MRTSWRILILLALMAVVGTVQGQEETETPDEMIEVEAGIITFEFPVEMASEVTVTDVEEVPMEDEVGYSLPMPAHVRVDFSDFSGAPDPNYQPYVLVIATAALAEFDGGIMSLADEAEALVAFFEEQPELETTAYPDKVLPHAPYAMGSPVFYVHPEYIEFEGGIGLRYLSYFAFSVDPIAEGSVAYTFQGLTDDGDYIISANFPVNTGVLPAPEDIYPEDFDYAAFNDNYDTYIQELVDVLDEQSAENFTPSLDELDAIFESIQVKGER